MQLSNEQITRIEGVLADFHADWDDLSIQSIEPDGDGLLIKYTIVDRKGAADTRVAGIADDSVLWSRRPS